MGDFGFLGKTISVLEPNTDFEETANFGAVNQTLAETKFEKEIKNKVNIIILDIKNENFETETVGKLELFGKTMIEYVESACISKPKIVECGFVHNVIDVIKPVLTDDEFTLVLYSDTPLVKKSVVLEILDYVYYNGLNVCKFSRGYCFKTEYIKRANEIYSAQAYSFSEESFLCVSDNAKLVEVKQIMHDKICDFHIKNGVIFDNIQTAYIDSDVVIEKGTIVGANVCILGSSEIDADSVLKVGSIVDNCKIDKNVEFCGFAKNSHINDNCKIEICAIVKNSEIGKNCTICESAHIEDCAIKDDCLLLANSCLYNATVFEGCKVNENVVVARNEGFRTKLFKNVELGTCAKIKGGISVGENVKVAPFEFVNKNINAKE